MLRLILFIVFVLSSSTTFAFENIIPEEWGSDPVFTFKSSPPPTHILKEGNLKQRIMDEYAQWKGTRYLWGGNSHNGIDCSAFTRRVIHTVAHLNLPRTAAEQSHTGYPVQQEQLKPGDLVFFMTKPNVRHVGVFVGNDQFIHASSSRGVMLSHLSGSYWQEHYLTARRMAPVRGMS
ncbi:NlpC/P60 family protein [Citrobacter sp. S2-9]|uniref:NlpC/P60 family protein n=1 Tax=Citrobacter enshiensis TaxID=2971264 RepID=A0ABT8PXP3_9ENTR|nr:NlpC/P60 family protein [Citrobacter enshiensis]MDN8601078.1 NlpC/P60 family protein [Citrobacter enshiensis]